MIKKKLSILFYISLLVFCIGLSSTSFALIADLSDFEQKYLQVLDFCVNRPGSTNYPYNEMKNLLNSNIWSQYKNNIPFGEYQNCIVRHSGITVDNVYKKRVDIFLWSYDTTYYITNTGTLKTNASFDMNYAISFFCDVGGSNYILNWERYNDWYWGTDHGSFDIRYNYQNYSIIFIDGQITNESTYDIPGKGYTYSVTQSAVPIYVAENGENWLSNIFIGQNIYNDIEFKIRDQYNNYINVEKRTTEAIYGRTGFLVFYGLDIVSGNRYYTEVYYNDNLIYTDPNGTIVYVIENEEESGENENINNDLTETNQKLDNIANIIESGNKEIIANLQSGEKKAEERQTFWEQAYDKMFKPSEEVISGELNSLMEALDFTSGESSGEEDLAKIGLDIINNQWGDFIISWTPKKTHFSIGGQQVTNQLEIKSENQELGNNQINFSDLERKSEDLQEVMKWVRVITSFIIFSAFAKQVYEVLLITLGINTNVYNMRNEEIRKQQAQEEKWKSDRDKQNYKEWLRRHKK